MSLELINTIASLTTVVVVGATAVAALRQLSHTAASNHISAMLTIGDNLQSDGFQNAEQLVSSNLARAMADPAFCAYCSARGHGRPAEREPEAFVALRRAAILIANKFEELGILVKNDVVERTLFLDRYAILVARNWAILEPFIAFSRRDYGSDVVWENFEYLTVVCQDWQREHPSSYPPGMRRLDTRFDPGRAPGAPSPPPTPS